MKSFRGLLILLACLFFLLIESSGARSIPEERANNTNNSSENSDKKNINVTVESTGNITDSQQIDPADAKKVSARAGEQTEPTIPFDFDSRHLPCDLDSGGAESVVWAFPNYCVWAWNNKYNDEKHYRVYKIYQLEGFFFGQYYERLKRFEMDPRVWDYSRTGIN